MANTMTLAEWAQHAKEPETKLFVSGLLKDSHSLFDKIPFTGVEGQTARAQTWTTLPTISFRPINQANYGDLTAGGVQDVIAHVYDLGGVHKIDHIFMKDKTRIRDPRVFEMERAREAMVRKFNAQFILGVANDAAGFPGLDDWLADNTAQIKDRSSAAILADAASLAAFTDDMHEMFTRLDGGKADVILVNDTGRLGVRQVLRRSNLLADTKDQYDRVFETYMGVPIINVGSKAGTWAASDYIIPTSSSTTNIYFVKLGAGYVEGLQLEGLKVEDIGYTSESDKTVYKIVISWIIGLMVTHRYSLAQLKNCKFATS